MMHYVLSGVLAAAVMLAQQDGATAKKAASTKRAAAAPAAETPAAKSAVKPGAAVELPKDAVELEPGLYSHKDAKGETWHYRKTPFGVTKFKPDVEKTAAADESAPIVAFDEGDTVRFERKMPFGVAKWSKKKSEMSAAEQAALERSRGGRPGDAPNKTAKQ